MKILNRAEVAPMTNSDMYADVFIEVNNKRYVIGKEIINEQGFYCMRVWSNKRQKFYEIPIVEETRSINLSDMIDSEGTKIFASLSEDGKGGDIVKCLDNYDWIAMYNKVNKYFAFYGVNDLDCELTEDWDNFKIIGIQQ